MELSEKLVADILELLRDRGSDHLFDVIIENNIIYFCLKPEFEVEGGFISGKTKFIFSNENNNTISSLKENIENFFNKSNIKDIIWLINNNNNMTGKNRYMLAKERDKKIDYITKILVKAYFSINSSILNFNGKKEIYIIGENGVGKTLLLQTILIGLKSKLIMRDSTYRDVGSIIDSIRQNVDFSVFIEGIDFLTKFSISDFVNSNPYPELKFVYAYGVHRSRSAEPSRGIDKLGFGTLFDDGTQTIYLCNPTDWLKEKQRLESIGENTGISLETAKSILREIVDQNIEIEIGKDVVFKELGTPVSFHQLSEGYKSVLTWVVDLFYRMGEDQPEAQRTQDFEGIVMVDEINLHLHPKWEYKLVRKLRELLPKVQFIFTTHSPVTILGASEDALFFKVYKDEKGHTCVTEADELQLANMRADQILTSPFFGLESARPLHLQGFMQRRSEILSKRELTPEDEAELKALEAKNGALPTGETMQEIKTMQTIQRLSALATKIYDQDK